MLRPGKVEDMAGILEIYNDAILHTTAVYTYAPFDQAYGQKWFKAKEAGNWPLLVAEEDGKIAGFATFGSFRDWPAYKYTIEHSIYIHPAYRHKGLASQLMQRLIAIANEREFATLVAGIDGENEASLALHVKLGFKKVGEIKKAGYKFGRWLTLAFYQLDLQGPAKPTEK